MEKRPFSGWLQLEWGNTVQAATAGLGSTKIRSHAHAVTDWIYCLEPPGSPRPQATGFPGVPGSKSSQLLHGRDFFILFHHLYILKYFYFQYFAGIISHVMRRLCPPIFTVFIHTVRLAVVRAVRPLDCIIECSNAKK